MKHQLLFRVKNQNDNLDSPFGCAAMAMHDLYKHNK